MNKFIDINYSNRYNTKVYDKNIQLYAPIRFAKGDKVSENSVIPKDILKIQKKLVTFKIGSRNHNKYKKILAKHIKIHNMKQRLNSNIKTIENIKNMSGY